MSDRQFLRLSERWALAYDKNQWIVQRRHGQRWRNVSFVASEKRVLVRVIKEKGVKPHPGRSTRPGTPSRHVPRMAPGLHCGPSRAAVGCRSVKMANRTTRTPKKRAAFLKTLAAGDSVSKACDAAGIGRRTAYDWRDADEELAAEWDDAVETGTDVLEDEAVQRAKNGSDTLLIFMLKARRPEKYKDHYRHEHTGAGGSPLLSPEWAALRATIVGALAKHPEAKRTVSAALARLTGDK